MRRARKIRHEETRRESEDYLEMVMFRDSWEDIHSLFNAYFGKPLKGPGEEAGEAAERVSEPHGGVDKDQILYHAFRDRADQLALIWPWEDGKRMTVKIVHECR